MTTDKLTDERLQELLEYPLRIQIGEHLDIITELLHLRAGVARAKELRDKWVRSRNLVYYAHEAADEILKGFEP